MSIEHMYGHNQSISLTQRIEKLATDESCSQDARGMRLCINQLRIILTW